MPDVREALAGPRKRSPCWSIFALFRAFTVWSHIDREMSWCPAVQQYQDAKGYRTTFMAFSRLFHSLIAGNRLPGALWVKGLAQKPGMLTVGSEPMTCILGISKNILLVVCSGLWQHFEDKDMHCWTVFCATLMRHVHCMLNHHTFQNHPIHQECSWNL